MSLQGFSPVESCLCSEIPLLCKETSRLLGCVLLEPSSGRQGLPAGSSVPRVENVAFPSLGGKGWHVGLVVMLRSGCLLCLCFCCVAWTHFVQLFLSLMGGEAGFYLYSKPQPLCPFVSQSSPLAPRRAHLSCSSAVASQSRQFLFQLLLGKGPPASLREGLVAVLGSAVLT